MSGTHLLDAKENGADLIVTPCPLCHSVLDTYQPKVEGELRKRINLPILHLPQLVGIAMGMDPETLGVGRHMIDPRDILRSYLSN